MFSLGFSLTWVQKSETSKINAAILLFPKKKFFGMSCCAVKVPHAAHALVSVLAQNWMLQQDVFVQR